MKRILVVAGEASADLHAANLILAINKKYGKKIEFSGLGGENLIATNLFTPEYNNSRFAVTGLFEIFGKFMTIYSALKHFKNMALLKSYDLAILLDYPDFNMSLAKHLHRIGVPVIYYISPQVWVWRQGRARILGRYCHSILSIFPFEKDFYNKLGVNNVKYVGHPLLDEIKKYRETVQGRKLRKELGVDDDIKLIAVLPGSRHNEIKHILPVMLQTCSLLRNNLKKIKFVLPVAPTLKREDILEYIPKDLDISIVTNRTYDVYSSADYAIVASGTATLECALFNIPMSIVYRVTEMSAWLYKNIVRYKGPIGMVNLLSGRIICNEFFQKNARPEIIAKDIRSVLFDDDNYAEVKAQLFKINNILDTGSSPSEKAAEEVLRFL